MDVKIYKIREIFRKCEIHKANTLRFSFLMGKKQISEPYSTTSKMRSSKTKRKSKDKRKTGSI